MKVKIGDKIHDSNNEPIMMIFEDCDKENISNMTPEATKYCSYPEDVSEEEIKEFMKTKEIK